MPTIVLAACATSLWAQSSLPSAPVPQAPSGTAPASSKPNHQDGNPFPENAAPNSDSADMTSGQTPTIPATAPSAKQSDSKQTDKTSGSDNPFPGEDSNAPIIPVDPGSNAAKPSADSPTSPASSRADSATGDPDADPVRSPDLPNNINADDGFSSSTKGIDSLPSDSDSSPVKPVKNRAQMLKEDIDVGEFYAEKKNWKASQERFESAFKLDSENPDAIFGLAEAEQHLNLLNKAREHYELFLSYDPEGPHGKAAKKALEQVEKEQARNGTGGVAPK